jgi:hypothetical protein
MKFLLKNVFSLVLCVCIALAAQSCIVTKTKGPAPTANKSIPPGQAKKMTGSQSAKPYAPGQQKKKN